MNLSYNFGQYNNVISQYMDIIVNNSRINFQQQLIGGKIKDKEHELDALATGIKNLEEYLNYIYQKTPKAFNHTINSIINNVKTISVLPNNMRGIYGMTESESKTIYINPDLRSSKYLTGEERTRLYMAHELGHVINCDWKNKAMEYANRQLRENKWTLEEAQLFYDGFSMLDEAIVQNRAENFTYEFSRKQRPALYRSRDSRLFGGEIYKTNFDYYGELQEPAIMFARTLRGIGKVNDDTKVLDMLSERAMFPDFFDNILNEYSRDGQMVNLIKEAQYMGVLKKAAYAKFGQDDRKYLGESKVNLNRLKDLTSRMRDKRESFDDTDGAR